MKRALIASFAALGILAAPAVAAPSAAKTDAKVVSKDQMVAAKAAAKNQKAAAKAAAKTQKAAAKTAAKEQKTAAKSTSKTK